MNMQEEMAQASSGQEDDTSPGEQLRRARQTQKLTRQDIADRLHLDLGAIAAIEADDYDHLPSATYVRGYLRSYARILSVPAEAIITAYNHFAPAPPVLRPDANRPEQARSSDASVKAVTYFISLALVILLLAWWQSHYVRTIPSEDLEIPADDEPLEQEKELSMVVPDGRLSYPIHVVIHPDTIAPGTREFDADELEVPVTTEEAPSNDPDQSSVADAIDTSGMIQTVALSAPSEPLPESPSLQGAVIHSAPDTLSMDLLWDSWIEVIDATGTPLYYQLAREGDRIFLQGTSPFSVLLGYAPGVAVKYNGKPFDTTPYSRAGVARFTLGEYAVEE